MDNYYPSESLDGEDSFSNRYGCLILIIATILFAIQRYFIFLFLGYLSTQASSTASSALDFLFGESPYSVFDVLLGFEIPDEGLFYLLQPRNWALGLVQAIHWGLNIGLATLPFRLFSQIKKSAGMRKWLGYSGCLALVLVPLILIFSVWSQLSEPILESLQSQASRNEVASTDKYYSNREYGIHFKYPDFLTTEADSMRDRGPAGEIITTTTILATSTDPLVGIIIRVIEDPLRNEMFPNLYPPDSTILRLMILRDLNDFEYDDTEENESAVMAASDNGKITKISGHDAAVYEVSLSNSTFGHTCIRGASVITEKRDISIFVVGSVEPGVRGSVEPEYIDSLWTSFVASLEIDY